MGAFGDGARRGADRGARRPRLDVVTFWREVGRDRRAARARTYTGPCWFTLDPASLLVTSHFNPAIPELPAEWLAHEYFERRRPQAGRRRALASRASRRCTRRPAATQPRARAGRPTCSYGGDQELLVALRTRAARPGACWASTASRAAALRRRGARLPARGRAGARRGRPARARSSARRATPRGRRRRDWSCSTTTGASSRSPRASSAGSRSCPMATGDAAAAAGGAGGRRPRAAHGHRRATRRARSRSRGCSRASRALDGAARRRARRRRARGASRSIIEPAHPARIAPLLMAAYGLTEREQDVTRLVLQGDSTAEIAAHSSSRRTPCSSTSRASSRRPASAAGATGRQGLLRPLRAAPARQRATRPRRPPSARRAGRLRAAASSGTAAGVAGSWSCRSSLMRELKPLGRRVTSAPLPCSLECESRALRLRAEAPSPRSPSDEGPHL